MARFKYTLFYDFHTSTINPDVGKNFDVEQFTDNLKECGVDFLTWHARCNQGNSYFNTKYGYRHPSLTYDMFGAIVESCHKKGIKVSAYMNGGISDEELLHNRDWMRISPDGHTVSQYLPAADLRATCYNSPFREHLKNMTRELAQDYHVDGFFYDCMGSYYSCVCPYCVKEMIERGINYKDPKEVEKFTAFSIIRLAKELKETAVSVNPDSFFYLNGSIVDEVTDLNTHLECECLPSCSALGYDYLPVHAHYLRTVANGHSVLCMTGRFYEWADFGGLRKPDSVEYDLLYGMANGMRPEIGDHFHPRGDSYKDVFNLVKGIYNNMQRYDEWCLDAVNVPEFAVLHLAESGEMLRRDVALKSAVRMLTELKMQFDLVTEAGDWSKYKLLILPDHMRLNEETAARLQAFVDNGGVVIASGTSGLAGESFPIREWPVEYAGPTPHNPLYFAPESEYAKGLPDMPLSVYSTATLVNAKDNAYVAMHTIKPYHNREWDGLHSNYYTPPQEVTDEPFLVIGDKVAYCSGEIFTGYFKRSPYHLRYLLGNILEHYLPKPKFKSATMPSYARAFVQKNGDMELLHLMAYAPELRGESVALEEKATLVDQELSLRVDGKEITKVYLAPERKELDFTVADGYCTVHLPLLQGYSLIVFE